MRPRVAKATANPQSRGEASSSFLLSAAEGANVPTQCLWGESAASPLFKEMGFPYIWISP